MSSNDTIIQLEDLKLIDRPLESPYDVASENKYHWFQTEEGDMKNLINFGDHSFMQGILEAYMNHKSITLSPDIMWIIVLQGFSYHVSINKESLRSMFVSFDEKKEITVENFKITPLNAKIADCIDFINQFVNQIGESTGKELTDILEPKFSTTTNVAHTAAMISIMSAMQNYFKYKAMIGLCGFPSITIEGTVEDWELMKSKVEYIAKYNLQWWTSELMPIIDEFINAKKGIIHKQFWLDTLKHKNTEGEYMPGYINGWICRFFPYDKHGRKNNLYELTDDVSLLPSEILNAPFVLNILELPSFKMDCELHSGFFGVKETKTAPGVYNVKPIIGWGLVCDAKKMEMLKRWKC